ncbi:hypothetical protein UAY_00494 [Enterococcus moraviensis ATCC BAA-383]|uniref:Uncharacterized protein n=1 Tax=Enterococcus moraviensis ATCC BAA-383 TaxID=1158609 RepID=R2R7Y0_9ENTE|nr:hypothetical protein [Enterococcus moraviensis]EOI05020.1 hypothetical protein UAY_00494 [Enterococcus moraviensis ATCC BAA-383]EOT63803.1 hypothetical protein I586_03236 [Enterococcus moraviensis ATCC BAA-383]
MDTNLLVILYFLVVVIVVLTLVIVRDKQFLRSLLEKKDILQEEITDLKVEKVRLKHTIRLQDETISHMLTSQPQSARLEKTEMSTMKTVEDATVQEWDFDKYESMNQEYYNE